MAIKDTINRRDRREDLSLGPKRWEETPKNRGHFSLRLPTGKRIIFAEESYYNAAWEAIMSRSFGTMLDMVNFSKSLETGFFRREIRLSPSIRSVDSRGIFEPS